MCSWRESNLLQLYQPHGHPYPIGEMNCGCVCCVSVVLHWAGNFTDVTCGEALSQEHYHTMVAFRQDTDLYVAGNATDNEFQ